MLKMIVGVISSALLALIYFVLEKQQINPVWKLEYYLFCHKYQTLAKIVQAVNRSFTSEENRRKQLNLIDAAKANIHEFHEILQKEIYLLDEKDTLEKKRAQTGLDPEEDSLLKGIAKELKQTRPQLWTNATEFDDLTQRERAGSWTFEFDCTREYMDVTWSKHKLHCARRLGCCTRACGCCNQSRQAHGGQQSLTYRHRSHCTSECGCCIRWRGFHHLKQPDDA